MTDKTKNSFLYNNSLSIAFLSLTVITVAQVYTSSYQYNDFLNEHNQNSLGHFEVFV